MRPWEIRLYQTRGGRIPFRDWLESLEMSLQARIDARLDRVRLGNLGDHKALGEGLFELRIHGGSGYLIYFATDREAMVLLLCGGGKDTQKRDIAKAKRYWRDYLESSS